MKQMISEQRLNRIVRQVMNEAWGNRGSYDAKEEALKQLVKIYHSLGADAQAIEGKFEQLYDAIESIGSNNANLAGTMRRGAGVENGVGGGAFGGDNMDDDDPFGLGGGRYGGAPRTFEDNYGVVLRAGELQGSGTDGMFSESDPLWRQIVALSNGGMDFNGRTPTAADIRRVKELLELGSVAISYIRRTNGEGGMAGQTMNRIGTTNAEVIRFLGGNPTPPPTPTTASGRQANYLVQYFDYSRNDWRSFAPRNLVAVY